MQPPPNALLPQEKALASDTLSADPSSATRAIAANFARDCRDIAKRVVVFMFEFLFRLIVTVASPPLGLPARDRQMIQPAGENKYRFDMQVSARAMGSHTHSSALGMTAQRDRFSKYSINGLRWRAAIAG
jgi:hypothetical protein